MKTNELSFLVGGFAGQGVQTAAEAFGRICTRAGLHVFIVHEYPSNIKGEHTYSHVMVSERPVRSSVRTADVLLALAMHADDNDRLATGIFYRAEQPTYEDLLEGRRPRLPASVHGSAHRDREHDASRIPADGERQSGAMMVSEFGGQGIGCRV